MAPKKTTKKAPARAAVKAKASPAKAAAESHAHVGDCCSADACGTCCGGWGVATRLWWSVAWRTFAWVSLPVMLLQVLMAEAVNPGVIRGMLNLFWMMSFSVPGMLGDALKNPGFWFFLAVTVYSVIGAIFVYSHLIRKGKFFGLSVCVDRDHE